MAGNPLLGGLEPGGEEEDAPQPVHDGGHRGEQLDEDRRRREVRRGQSSVGSRSVATAVGTPIGRARPEVMSIPTSSGSAP